jgi:uncharacterized protein YuzE
MKLNMTLSHDLKADAAYVTIGDRSVVQTKKLDQNRLVDYDAHGEIVGIEFLSVSHGVDLSELPYRDELVRLFEQHHIKQLV